MTRLPILAALLALIAAPVAAQGVLTLSKATTARVMAGAAATKDERGTKGYLGGALGDEPVSLPDRVGGIGKSVVGDGSPDKQGLAGTICALMPANEGCAVAKK